MITELNKRMEHTEGFFYIWNKLEGRFFWALAQKELRVHAILRIIDSADTHHNSESSKHEPAVYLWTPTLNTVAPLLSSASETAPHGE